MPRDVVKVPFSSPITHTFLTGSALSFTGGVPVGPNIVVYVADGTAFVPERKGGPDLASDSSSSPA
jgi:hypothetical protein